MTDKTPNWLASVHRDDLAAVAIDTLGRKNSDAAKAIWVVIRRMAPEHERLFGERMLRADMDDAFAYAWSVRKAHKAAKRAAA